MPANHSRLIDASLDKLGSARHPRESSATSSAPFTQAMAQIGYGVTGDEVLNDLMLRAAHCRVAALSTNNHRTSAILQQMARNLEERAARLEDDLQGGGQARLVWS